LKGTQTHLEFIPEHTTDFIFAAFSEEFGLVGNLLLIAAFIFLILRGWPSPWTHPRCSRACWPAA